MSSYSWEQVQESLEQHGDAFNKFTRASNAKLDELLDRIENVEAKAGAPGATSLSGTSREHTEHKDRFCSWVRDPHNEQRKQLLIEAESDLSQKDVGTTSNAGGGFAVPLEIEREVERFVTQLSPLRSMCKVVTVGSPSYRHLLDIRGESVGWVGETDTRNATNTPNLRSIVPTFGTLYAYPAATEEAVNDIGFDVASWLVEDISDQFAAEETTRFISGNGTNKPTGMLNTDPATTADDSSPLRDQATYQYIGLTNPGSPVSVNFASLVDLVGSVQERYLMGEGVGWLMRRTTLAAVRKLSDTTGQPIWTPGMSAGNPSQLLGYPIRTTDAAPAYSVDNFIIGFGNFRRGYLIADIQGLRITLDDNITAPGYLKWYVRKRLGGIPLNVDAVKWLRLAD